MAPSLLRYRLLQYSLQSIPHRGNQDQTKQSSGTTNKAIYPLDPNQSNGGNDDPPSELDTAPGLGPVLALLEGLQRLGDVRLTLHALSLEVLDDEDEEAASVIYYSIGTLQQSQEKNATRPSNMISSSTKYYSSSSSSSATTASTQQKKRLLLCSYLDSALLIALDLLLKVLEGVLCHGEQKHHHQPLQSPILTTTHSYDSKSP